MKLNVAMIDEVAKVISEFMKDYKAQFADKEPEERPKVLFVILVSIYQFPLLVL